MTRHTRNAYFSKAYVMTFIWRLLGHLARMVKMISGHKMLAGKAKVKEPISRCTSTCIYVCRLHDSIKMDLKVTGRKMCTGISRLTIGSRYKLLWQGNRTRKLKDISCSQTRETTHTNFITRQLHCVSIKYSVVNCLLEQLKVSNGQQQPLVREQSKVPR